MNWTIAIPVYGREHSDKFHDITLPRLVKCLEGFARFDRRVQWVIHTDRPADVNVWIPGAICVEVKGDGDYMTFVEAHKQAWANAKIGDAVCFLCADIVPSKNAFVFADWALGTGKKAVVAAGIRTCAPEPPPIGAEAGDLLEFSMKYPHKITKDQFFPEGGSENPTNVFFHKDGSVVLRAFHLHPFAVVKQDSTFRGTVDNDLLQAFDIDDIYVVGDREMALVEMSPESKYMRCCERPFKADDIRHCMDFKGLPIHKKLIEHRIRILGDADCGDAEILAREGIRTREARVQ